MAAISEEFCEEQSPEDDRKARMNRYALRDKVLVDALAAFLTRQLICLPSFRTVYERVLCETDGNVIRKLLFTERDEWICRRDLADKQKPLRLPKHDLLGLEEALTQLLPLLRRGKLPSVAKAHALAVRRATDGRLTTGI